MRGTRNNVSHSRIAFMLLFAGLLVLLSAGSAFAQATVHYTLTVCVGGPADPPNPGAPTANAYIVAGTLSLAPGIYSQAYAAGATVNMSLSSVNPDYKFGQNMNGGASMTPQSGNYATAAQDTTGDDLYWLASNMETGAVVPLSFKGGVPQTATIVMNQDTVITAWFVRVNIIQELIAPVGYGNIFEPLDGTFSVGISYVSAYGLNGVAVQVLYEDNMPVQKSGSIAAGAGDQVIVDIAPNTGEPGAILFHPKGTNDTPNPTAGTTSNGTLSTVGGVQFQKLQIDRPGAGYYLEYKYYMNRATVGGGGAYRAVPFTTDTTQNTAVPILYTSTSFDILPAVTAHFATGYNYFGQLGNGLVTPATKSASDTSGLPIPSNWLRTTPPTIVANIENYPSQLMPQIAAEGAAEASHAVVGPVGLAGDYLNGNIGDGVTIGYPHWFEQEGYALEFAGWLAQAASTLDLQWDGQYRAYVYPDDFYAFGRDHYDTVQPYHTSQCQGIQANQTAFNAVSAGEMFSTALDANGVLWAWGDNTYGQCGMGKGVTGTYTQQPPPPEPQVSGFNAFADPQVVATLPGNTASPGNCVAVAAGFQHVVALKGDGTVWTWGRNNEGQLALGTTDDQAGGHPTATQVTALTNVVAVASGDYFSLALKRDGSVWGWGDNSEGQLGDGTTTGSNTPVQVLVPAMFNGQALMAGGKPVMTGLGSMAFTGHTAAILGAATSPDGQYVLTCSSDGTARLSDAYTGALIRTIASSGPNAHTGPINAVAFSPDGTKILTCSTDRTAKLWLVDGTYLATFVDTTIGTSYSHQGSVTSVAFSPDGNYVATGSVDNTAKVWSTTNTSPAYALVSTCGSVTVSTLGINAVAFSANFPAYNRIYTAAGDQTVKIYEPTTPTGTLARNFNGPGAVAHSNAVTSIAVMKSGSDDWVVTGSADCTAILWLVPSGSDLETLDFTFQSLFNGNTSGHYDTIMSVAITQDANTGTMYILTGSKDKSVKRWDNSSGSWALDESYTRHTDSVNVVAFGYGSVGVMNENLVLTASSDLTAVLGTTPAVTAVAAGTAHSLFLKEDGTVWGCGFNNLGQLGQGDGAAQNYLNAVQILDPYDPSGFLQNIAGVSAGNTHSAAVTNAANGGNILSWGSNTHGELAQGPGTDGTPAFSTTPLEAVDENDNPISGMQAVSAGWGYSLARGYNAVTQTAAIYAWGQNNHGQLGIDGPSVTPSDLNGDWPSATLWTSPIAPGGSLGQYANTTTAGTAGNTVTTNSPMTTLSARYWHSQIVNFTTSDPNNTDSTGTFYTMTWNIDPPLAGVVIPDTSNSGLTAGTTSQTGVAGQTMYTLSSASGTATAESGTSVRLMAIPRPGYSFDHWAGFAPSQTDQTAWKFVNFIEPIAPLQITAYFTAVPRQYTVTIASNPSGPVTTGAGTYNEDTVAQLSAAAKQTINNQNYIFDHWSGDPQIENSRLPTVYLRMNGNKAITAYFVAASQVKYTLTVQCNPPAGGSITDVTNNPASPLSNGTAYTYQQGTTVLLNATPNAGYVFSRWVETDAADPDQLSSTTTENTSLTMSSSVTAKSITAFFTASSQTYILTTQTLVNSQASNLGGTVSPVSGGTYAVNTMVTVQATATSGYSFAGWSSNVTPNSLNPTTGTVLMNQAQLVQANFTQGSLSLAVQSLPFGGVTIVSPSGQGGATNYAVSVNGNLPITLTAPATATSNRQTYYFAYWTLNGYAQAQGVTTLSFTMGPSDTAVATYQQDNTPPAVAQEIPVVGSVQNATDTIIQLQVTDSQSGVNLSSVTVEVEGDLIYDGSKETTTTGTTGEYDTSALTSQAVYGYATRTGNPNDYTISFQPIKPFHYEQLVHVIVNASDNAGNVMTPFSYTFTTQMRLFGQNIRANTNKTIPNYHPATIRDVSGNSWVVWDASDTALWLGELPAGATAFQPSVQIDAKKAASPTAPILAVSQTGSMYMIWQDRRNGHWDLFGLSATNGIAGPEFPDPSSPATAKSFVWTGVNQTNPSAAVDGTGKIYVVWENTPLSGGVSNIYVSFSTNLGLTWSSSTTKITPPAAINSQTTAQTHPSIAIDSANNVYVVWADARNLSSTHGYDIFGAMSADGGATWSVATIVSNAHSNNAVTGQLPAPVAGTESSGSILHIAWVGDGSGDDDIYYASTSAGLPTSPLTGTDIIDDTTSGKPHVAPAIAVSGSGDAADVFITWQDSRNVTTAHPLDKDIYFCEVWAGIPGTNILVNDDGTTSVPPSFASQTNPCIGVDINGQAYMAWEDQRVSGRQDIWFAGTSYANPSDTSLTLEQPGGPYTIQLAGGASVQIPALPMEALVSITGVLNPPPRPATPVGNCYTLGPSNLTFTTPVTVTVPIDLAAEGTYPSYQAYWLDYQTGLWLNDGISAVTVNATADTAIFNASHFTLFSVAGLGTPSTGTGTGTSTGTGTASSTGTKPPSSGGGGGGCFIATSAYEAEVPTLPGTFEVNLTGRYLLSPERLQKLNDIRELRDGLLLRVPEGRAFSAWYYAVGPYAANAIRDNESAKAVVRAMVLNPLAALSKMCEGETQSK